jgi:hypothetical protein
MAARFTSRARLFKQHASKNLFRSFQVAHIAVVFEEEDEDFSKKWFMS